MLQAKLLILRFVANDFPILYETFIIRKMRKNEAFLQMKHFVAVCVKLQALRWLRHISKGQESI